MKSTSHGTVSVRIRSAMKKTAPLRTPTRRRSLPAKSFEISSPSSVIRACSVGSSISTSPTACSSSTWVTFGAHPLGLDDAGNGHDIVAAHDERPRLALGTGDLGVDEHVLDLLLAA